MTQQNHAFDDLIIGDAGRHYAQLHEVLQLVESIAGGIGPNSDAALDDSARVSSAYDVSPPIVQRRFDTLAAEMSAWASAGVDALAAAGDHRRQPKAAASRLAEELGEAMANLKKLLRV